MPTTRPAAFLDRDGVINRANVRDGRPYPPASVEDLNVLLGVPEALATLRAAGLAIVVVTNQPDVARGTVGRERVEAINARLCEILPIDEIRVCWHDDADDCACRKPKPGLIVETARERGLDLSRSVMVGDRWKDIAAGRQAGVRTVLVDYRYAEVAPSSAPAPDLVVGSLLEAVPWILDMLR
ncbi:MAG: HAD family hydrolase [Dehalococcoidia bacterium]